MIPPRTVKNVISLRKWREKTFTDIFVFDIDNTIFESVGTFETDYDLDKFQRDNTFFRNLFLRKLPLFYAIKNYYGKHNKLVVIQTARAKKWWLPILRTKKCTKKSPPGDHRKSVKHDLIKTRKWWSGRFKCEK